MSGVEAKVMLIIRSGFMIAIFAYLATISASANSAPARSSGTDTHAILELRQYTLIPGKRDALIDLFERYFVESQEQCGMLLVGQFRDLNNPDRFVWLRAFTDLAARPESLSEFYFGPVWQKHRSAANRTMIDSDNVLLLRPAHPGAGFSITSEQRRPLDAKGPGQGLVSANIVYLRRSTPGSFIDHFDAEILPALKESGALVMAEFATEDSANTFPQLPVRSDEHVFVWFSSFADRAAFDRHRRALAESGAWRTIVANLSLWTHQSIETLLLEPTARSLLHGGLARECRSDSASCISLFQGQPTRFAAPTRVLQKASQRKQAGQPVDGSRRTVPVEPCCEQQWTDAGVQAMR